MRCAKTPYQRVLDSEQVNPAVKEKLMSIYNSLDPVELLKSISGCTSPNLKN